MDEPTSLYTIPVTVYVTVSYFEMLKYIMLKATLLLVLTNCRRISWGGHNALERHSIRSITLERMIFQSDLVCVENTRMNRRAFYSLCDLLSTVGRLRCDGSISVEEAVTIFLHILAHDEKNRVIKRQFVRSGESISRQFRNVLNAVIRCHNILLKKPTPIPEDSTDERWKWFKNCLGALDGTYVQVNVYDIDKARYRTRKKEVATNVLGVCSPDMQFIYILPGWKRYAADSRVLRDAITRRNGLDVPHGYYYLCDAGYPNGEGFLTPYRGQRYHLSDWNDGRLPRTAQEFYNYKHSSARNVIERCFGLLKGRWAILRGKLFYPVKIQCRIIAACALIHNHIRRKMPIDPLDVGMQDASLLLEELDGERITHIESTDEWTNWRDILAHEMFTTWRSSRIITELICY